MRSETTTRRLDELVREFSTGAILLPQFQRDYVWKPAKIRNLLDSLLKGFPVGGFYFWRPSTGTRDPRPTAFGTQDILAEFRGYLIDGQQRLTSLEAACGLYAGEDRRGAELRCFLDVAANDDDRRRDTKLFVTYAGNNSIARRVDAGDSTLVGVEFFFHGVDPGLRAQTEQSLVALPGWDRRRVEMAMRLFDRASKMFDQPVPCTTVYDVSDAEAVEVFSRLNKGGSPLRQGDVRAAELARGRAVDVLKKMRQFVVGERPQRLGFGFSFAFRALVLFHRESAQFSTLKPDWMESAGPHGRSLAESWRVTQRAIERSLEFLDTRMGWSRRALVPSANAAIVLGMALDKESHELDEQTDQLYRRWLCVTALRGVFQGSVETTLNRFARAIRDTKKRPSRALLAALKRDEGRRVRADELDAYSQLWGPATQVMVAWCVGRQAKDWLSGDLLDSLARGGNPSLPGGDLTVHHLFARRILADQGYEPDEANVPANFAILSRSSNSEFGDRPADEVFKSLSPAEREIAAQQFFGQSAGDKLSLERYEEFCEWRAARLAEAINEWLGIE